MNKNYFVIIIFLLSFGNHLICQNDTGESLLSVSGTSVVFSFVPTYTSVSSELRSGSFTVQVPCGSSLNITNIIGTWSVGAQFSAADYSAASCGTLTVGSCFRRITIGGVFEMLTASTGVPIPLFSLDGAGLCPMSGAIPIQLVEPSCAALSNDFSIDGDGAGAQATNSNAYLGISSSSESTTCAALPIELLSFNAKDKNTHIALDWTTASEINNDRFIIERSADGVEFESIATVDGAGTSSQVLEYSYDDYTPIVGMNYYRLVNVDFDEAHHYNEIRSVEFGGNSIESASISIYPNPVTNSFSVVSEGDIQGQTLRLMDLQGRVISETTYRDGMIVDMDDMAAGIYRVMILSASNETLYHQQVLKTD